MFLPGARGFDTYLGIPYSDDMGKVRLPTHSVTVNCQYNCAAFSKAARSPCPGEPEAEQCGQQTILPSDYIYTEEDDVHGEVILLCELGSIHSRMISPYACLVRYARYIAHSS